MNKLHQALRAKQAIPFVDFMQMALYAPQEGYYSGGLLKLGRDGDFITAPELTPLFGQTLAKQCQQLLTALDHPVILEYGAGTGTLCVDLLASLQTLDCLPEHYYILELSASLRHRQQEYIQQALPALAHKVQWLDAWPKSLGQAVILANEVLDAMPVHRFMQTADGLMESYVTLSKDETLQEIFKPSTDARLIDYVTTRLDLPTPYLSEANLFLDAWVQNNYRLLTAGAMLVIDYGFPRHEYYHPDRNQGTLMCHYQHHAHTNPMVHVGEQDITAHVDFTHVAEAAVAAGFQVAGFTNQAAFLLANDLLSCIDSQATPSEQCKTIQAIKQLTHPSEMGELFKVIALTKNIDLDLTGFQLQDKRASL